MEIKRLGNLVGLVITGDFSPEFITAQWAIDNSVLTEEECCKTQTRRLDASLSVFTISKDIEVLCTKDRLQVTSTGEFSSRVPDITKRILLNSGTSNITSIGVNALFDFTFNRRSDGYQFGNFFIPLSFWKDYLRDGRVFEFTIAENKTQVFPDSTNSINIKSIPSKKLADGTPVAAVRMSGNYDFRLSSIEHCIKVIERSMDLFSDFWQKSNDIINKVN